MRYTLLFLVSFIVSVSSSAQINKPAEENDYTKGTFFVNEDWYGHQNGSVNFLSDNGEWTYRVFQKSNPGKVLGSTTQYGAIYGDKFYIISKQEKDPGVQITGSRFTVCDAKTMICLKEFKYIATDDENKSIADGRSFVGVNEKKGYIGTSNGIWVYDMEKMEIGKQIEDTGNPNKSGYGQLYYAQIGNMVRTEDYVFAVHQQDGIKIIDPDEDIVITTVKAPTYEDENGETKSRGFGSIVRSKDGTLWISMAANTLGNGATLPFIMKMDPYSFETTIINIPIEQGIEEIPNSWYAWTADSFCSSAKENKLYWGGNNENSWFKGRRIYCYDIDKGEFSKVFDFEQTAGEWILYGTGFRIHPVNDELYCSLFHQFQDPAYQAARISNDGTLLAEYPMITNYWFPAMPVFPDNEAPVVNDIPDIVCNNTNPYTYPLKDLATDADNMDIAIVKTVISNTAYDILEAKVANGSLHITPVDNQIGSGVITIRFNSNGKLVDKNVNITVVDGGLGIGNSPDDIRDIYSKGKSVIFKNCDEYLFSIYNTNGQLVKTINVENNHYEKTVDLPEGIYLLRGQNGRNIFNTKIFIK